MKTLAIRQQRLDSHDYSSLQMQTLRPREAKRLAMKHVHGGAKAGLPTKALSLPSGPLSHWMLYVKVEGTAHGLGEQPKQWHFGSVDKKEVKSVS